MMRTTLTLDDQLVSDLKRIAHETGAPFKQVVNNVLRAGLRALDHPEPQTYRIKPVSLGPVRPGIDLDKALRLADMLEDESLLRELERRV
jgi:hypothetical protein